MVRFSNARDSHGGFTLSCFATAFFFFFFWICYGSNNGCRRILFFPYGNHVEHASFYLEQAWEKEPPENWYACVQFALVLWNVNDPSIYVTHGTRNLIYTYPTFIF